MMRVRSRAPARAGEYVALRGMTRASAAFVLGVSLVSAGAGWKLLLSRPDAPPPMESATAAWLAGHAPGEPASGVPQREQTQSAIRRQAEELILGPSRPRESVLWLEALGIRHLVSNNGAKYGPLLEAEHEDDAGYRVYRTPVCQPAPAVIVSRRGWKKLPAPRSLYDRAALAAYVSWSNRPEAAGWRELENGEREIRADLGPDEVILLRQSDGTRWAASMDGRPIPVLDDPIGCHVLDPGRPGAFVIRLTHQTEIAHWLPWRKSGPALTPLPARAIPFIDSGGIIDGVRHTPSPVAPGAIISIFGADLAVGSSARVLAGGRALEVFYAGSAQINARLPADLPPGPVEIVVETPEGRSEPAAIEIGAK